MVLRGKIKLAGRQRSFRTNSARDLWWKELQKWDGKPVQDWIDAMAASPPTKPKKGKYKDTGEPPSGYFSWYKHQGLVTNTEDDTTSNEWTDIELEAAISTYAEMLSKLDSGGSIVKARYFENLADRFGRTISANEYRMQNISSILADMGIEWIPGLPPAKHVGPKVTRKIVKIIRDGGYFEDRIRLPISDADKLNKRVAELRSRGTKSKPKGNKKPRRSSSSREQIDRDPEIVAWTLNNASGICECCNNPAPFIRSKDGTEYLEVHHVKMLGLGGPDTIENAVALCPNCHRELHFGVQSEELIETLYNEISRLLRE